MEDSLSWIDIISLVSGIASVIMAILAIWLSITFYKMSDQSSKEIGISSNDINNNVNKLEKMFDTMYSDTFGMVKDTVEHMRKQADKEGGIDISQEVNNRVEEAVNEALKKLPNESISKEEVKELVLGFVEQSKETESKVLEKSSEEIILNYLRENGSVTYIEIKDLLESKLGSEYNPNLPFKTLVSLADKGLIVDPFDRDGSSRSIGMRKKIQLKF